MTRLGAVALGFALLLGSAACGDKTSTDDASSPASTPASTPASSSESPSESPSETRSESPSESDSPQDKLAAYAELTEKQVEETYGDFNGLYDDIRVEPLRPGGLEFVYVFAKPVDKAKAVPALRKQRRLLRLAFEDQIVPEMTKNGFAKPRVRWTYLNPDGSEIWRFAVSS